MVIPGSRYTELSRAEWGRLRADTPLTLTPEDLLRLQGLNERVAMDESTRSTVGPIGSSRLLAEIVLTRSLRKFSYFSNPFNT